MVGLNYQLGKDVEIDWDQAKHYYSLACENGHYDSCRALYEMGYSYYYGKDQNPE